MVATRQADYQKTKTMQRPLKNIWDKILQISSKANGRYTNPTVKT